MPNIDIVYLLATRPGFAVSAAFLTALLIIVPLWQLLAPPVGIVFKAGIESMF